MLLSSVTSGPRSAGDGQVSQGGLGFGNHALDHLARRHDVLDESRALAARGVAALDVAVLAGADGGREADALGLEREGQDLGRALLPLARKVVADGAARFSSRAAVHHRAFLVD